MREQPPIVSAPKLGLAVALVLAFAPFSPLARVCGQEPTLGEGPASSVQLGPDGQIVVQLDRNQRREVGSLVARLRRASDDPQKQDAVIEEAIELGPTHVAGLLLAIDKMLAPQVARYFEKLQLQATTLATKRALEHQQEIVQLRAALLGLSSDPNLTKEAIVAKADPAIARLAEILRVGLEEVFEQSANLKEQRQALETLGGQWEKCAVYLHRNVPGVRPALGGADGGVSDTPSFQERLGRQERVVLALALPMDPKSRMVLATNDRLAPQLDREEARAVAATNAVRGLAGLAPLWIDLKLCAAARDHSQDMEKLNFFSHQSPVPGKASMAERAKRFGTTASAENIYRGIADGSKVVQGWFHSPPHHKNLLGNHRRIGVGRSGTFFTQMFGR